MSYATCESALITVLKLLTTSFGTTDVTAGDYRCLNNGAPNHAIVLPGGFGDNGIAGGVSTRSWDLLIDLYKRFDGDSSYHDFAVLRDAVIAHLDKYPTLNHAAGVTVRTIISSGDPRDIMDEYGKGPFWVAQMLRVTVTDRAAVTGGEF